LYGALQHRVGHVLEVFDHQAIALSTRDHTESPPSFLGSLSIALDTLGRPPFQMKDCTHASILLRASSHPSEMPAWYHD
jgi:hypothetical protein